MNIVFMGTPDFAVQTLRALYAAGHNISMVVTQPDKPRGRHGTLQRSEVAKEAELLGLSVMTPERIRTDAAAKELLRVLAPDVIVVTAFGQILPQDVLDIPKYGCINVHASLLPKYRGAAPIQWAILNGDAVSGVTTMQMNAGLDTGDILEQRILTLDKEETGGSLFDKLALLGGELVVHTLKELEAGRITPVPQDDAFATKVTTFTKESGRIDWTKSAAELERKVRGLNPWPSAFTTLRGKTLKLWDTDVVEETALASMRVVAQLGGTETEAPKDAALCEAEAGALATDGKRMAVRCGEGWLLLNEVQLEGKKRMPAADFLRGHSFG